MEVFTTTELQKLNLYSYHGYSISKNGLEYKIEYPYDGFQLFSETVVMFKYKPVKLTHIYDITFDEITPIISKFLSHLDSKKYIKNLTKCIEFDCEPLIYIRYMTILLLLLNENNITYKLHSKAKILDEIYSNFKFIITYKDIDEYSENPHIKTHMATYLTKINYNYRKISDSAYEISCPYYMGRLIKEDIISDIIFAYYLKPWKI